MEFKRTFSSNLQNSVIKRSQSKQQQILPSTSVTPFKDLSNDGYVDLFGQFHKSWNQQSQNDGQTETDKATLRIQRQVCLNSSKSLKKSRKNTVTSPILTLNRKSITRQVSHHRTYTPAQLKTQSSQQRTNSNASNQKNRKIGQNTVSQSHYRSYASDKSRLNHNGVRLGSMLFNPKGIRDQNKENLRESKSFDKLIAMKSQKYQKQKEQKQTEQKQNQILCMNNDGRQAKYKVIRMDYTDSELFYYCSTCANTLVRQGFLVQDLNRFDIQKILKHRQSQKQNQFNKMNRGNQQHIKFGMQIKSKISSKLDKLNESKQIFNANYENSCQNIDKYYKCLIKYIDDQRLQDRQQLLKMKAYKKAQVQKYEHHLTTTLHELDNFLKNSSKIGKYNKFTEMKNLLQSDLAYPKGAINVQPVGGFHEKIKYFIKYFDQNIKLNIVESNKRRPKSLQMGEQPRLSFEEALQRNKSMKKIVLMESLQQENQEDSENNSNSNEKQPFRDLFPESSQPESEEENECNSPVFKQF